MKVYIHPSRWHEEDRGDGGVRRVVEAQRKHLPAFGIEVVDDPAEADVLAAHMVAPAQFMISFRDKPLVAHNHGFYWAEYSWAGNWAEIDNAEVMRLVKTADIVTAPSEWVARIIRRHTSRDVRPVHHGVEPLEPASVDARRYVLWNKTRPDPVCDPAPVRELAMRMPATQFRTTFWREEADPMQATDVPPNVVVTGRQPYETALQDVVHAGVYLCTTRETFGIGTLEAMSAGVPVVGYRWGGQAEFIEHLKDGYLAEPGDVQDLARGITWALQYRDQVGAWARAKAAEFTWEKAAAQYAAIYQEAFDRYSPANGAPAVSIIVPAYNLDRYLPDTLRSVQTQTVADWECIVVDDASPDDCGAIAEQFAAQDPRFRVIHNDRNLHLADSRNVAIREARGRYILPLDADDMLPDNAVDMLRQALDRDRNLWITYAGVRFVDEDGQTPTVYQGRESTPGFSGWPVPFDIRVLMQRPGQPMPYASMYRRDAWRLTGGYRARCRSSEDCDFWMRTASYGFTPKQVGTAPALLYRNREHSMSRDDGWADVENKRWFPWRLHTEVMPAGAWDDGRLQVLAMDPPIVSVVIPVGPGHASLVRDAIDSVDAQTFRRWECIVVNDTGEALPELPTWVRVFATAGATGVVNARNLGAMATAGEFLLFLDADDYLMPDAMELLIAASQTRDGAVVVYSDFWSEYADGRFVNDPMPDWSCRAILSKALHAVTALYPREAFDSVGGFSQDVPWEDWDLQLKLAAAGVCSRRLASPVWVYSKDTGTRREDRYARRDDGKAAMLAHWGDYIEGRRTLAGCASCGSNRTQTVYGVPAPARGAQFYQKPANMPDAVLIEYIGPRQGKQTFRGKATNLSYNFQIGRPRWCNSRDAEFFLTSPTDFRRVADVPTSGGPVQTQEPAQQATEPTLTAPGRFRGTAATVLQDPPPAPPPVAQPAPPEDQDFGPRDPFAIHDLPAPPPAPPQALAEHAALELDREPPRSIETVPPPPPPAMKSGLTALPKIEPEPQQEPQASAKPKPPAKRAPRSGTSTRRGSRGGRGGSGAK